MNLSFEAIKEYCLTKPAAFEDYPFGPEATVIKICSKMFGILSYNNSKTHISLKCDPFIAQTLRQQYPSITPGYHLNKQNWNTTTLDGTVPDSEVFWMIDHSYDLVKKSLSKSEKESIR